MTLVQVNLDAANQMLVASKYRSQLRGEDLIRDGNDIAYAQAQALVGIGRMLIPIAEALNELQMQGQR
jgi:hypothetical protein